MEKYNLVPVINHVLGYLCLNIKGIYLKKIYHDYNKTQTKWNGVNMIKDLGAINFEIKFIVYDLSESSIVCKHSS